jgi:dienelactone hydrolase
MRAGDVDWQMNVYGRVVHSFTDPDADRLGRPDVSRYNRAADMRSWLELRRFLKEAAPA